MNRYERITADLAAHDDQASGREDAPYEELWDHAFGYRSPSPEAMPEGAGVGTEPTPSDPTATAPPRWTTELAAKVLASLEAPTALEPEARETDAAANRAAQPTSSTSTPGGSSDPSHLPSGGAYLVEDFQHHTISPVFPPAENAAARMLDARLPVSSALEPEAVAMASSDTEPAQSSESTRDDAGRRTGLRGHQRLLAAAVALVAIAASAGVLLHRSNGLPAGTAFEYEGKRISVAQLNTHISLLRALYGIAPPAAGSSKGVEFRKDAAKSYAVSLLVDRAVKDRHLAVTDADVSAGLARFIKQEYPQGQASFVAALGQQGITQAQVTDEIRRQLEVRSLYDNVTKDVSISAADIAGAYDANRSSYALPALRDVRELVVATKPAATALLAQLRSGASFAALVKAHSLDTSTTTTGGDLGKVAQAQLDTRFGPAAFAAPVGGFFGPVAAENGYFYLGQVVSQDPPRQQTLNQVTATVREQLLASRGLVLWQAFLGSTIKAAHVQYAPDYRPTNPDAAPADVRTASTPGTGEPGRPRASAAPTK